MEDQLSMMRHDLENLPPIHCPTGYRIRSYRAGDAEYWARLMDIAFVDMGRTAEDTHTNVINHPDFDPDGFCFVTCDSVPIGTACAWRRTVQGQQVGYIDMLAVRPEHTGQRLGKSLTVYLLHYFKRAGLTAVLLDTDDHRLPAIKTYLNLGFVPRDAGETHRARWRAVFEKLASYTKDNREKNKRTRGKQT